MNTKKMLAAAVIAAFTAAGSATAATYDLSTLVTGDNYLSGGEDLVVKAPIGSFNDIFHFTLAGVSGLGVDAGVLNFGKFQIADASFNYSLYAGTLSTVAGTTLATGTNNSGFSLAPLTAGSYTLFVNGIANGTKGGQYNGALTVTAVPEPESYAMLLAGLGLMGTIARRRSKAKAV